MAALAATGTRWPPFPTRAARVLHPSRRGRPLLPRPTGLWGLPGLPRPAPACPTVWPAGSEQRWRRGLCATAEPRPSPASVPGLRRRRAGRRRGPGRVRRPRAWRFRLRRLAEPGRTESDPCSLIGGARRCGPWGNARFCAGDPDIGLLSPSLKWES